MRAPNRIIGYFNKAYYKGAKRKESAWTMGAKTAKRLVSMERYGGVYTFMRKLIYKFVGRLVWPNTFPASVDPVLCEFLYNLVRLQRPGAVLETGTAYGYSSIAMAQALEENEHGKIYTIDIQEQFLTHEAIKKSGLTHRIEYVIGDSGLVLSALSLSKIDMAFIDASHDFEPVLREFNLIDKILCPGGLLIFHDSILFEGVKSVVDIVKLTGRYEMVTLPTLSGHNRDGKPVFVFDQKDIDGFTPVGLTICRKLKT